MKNIQGKNGYFVTLIQCLPACFVLLPAVCDLSHHAGCNICEHEKLCKPVSPGTEKSISLPSITQIPIYLVQHIHANFCFHQSTTARIITHNAGPPIRGLPSGIKIQKKRHRHSISVIQL
jgi:hypothetical protein